MLIETVDTYYKKPQPQNDLEVSIISPFPSTFATKVGVGGGEP